MQPYTGFASVYDLFMDNVPYEEWTDYVVHLLKKYGVEQGIVLELGCGTGSMTSRLSARGYDMIGIDSSEEMLSIAREKSSGKEDILYLCQDMRNFELYGTVAAVVSVCDSMNYILTEEDLLEVFRLVNNYLDPRGIFIFDLDTEYAYEEVIGDATIAENREEGSFIWENTYYKEEMINEINLSLFLPVEEEAPVTEETGDQ
ncbi:MAG TPA: SAM-dependent methyltransferase, partial [Lachnospiraceae bacterium]|nr:SAM-dependent methyltransferase [Lachnospiraceae bacterium]HCM12382.1 SAM-dependent methyltransferase [Lachnospiraceae bacterium]